MSKTKRGDYLRVVEDGMKEGWVVVRTRDAGVHVGKLMDRSDSTVLLGDARRIWRWRGANTLHEMATKGVSQDWTRISEPVEHIVLLGAIEILPVSERAIAVLTQSRWAA